MDTIAAIATPPGRGGIGIIRLSGEAVPPIILEIIGYPIRPRYAHVARFLDAERNVLDQGIALYFPAPHSFTGESVLELHTHGSPVLLDVLLQRLCSLGVRLARPGEFSERAFLNGKCDLAQAEAIADLINSTTQEAARSAQRSLQGEFSRRIHTLLEKVIQLRLYVESAIDFSDEEIDFLSEGRLFEALQALVLQLQHVSDSAKQGQLLRDGIVVVIAGYPNAGKSSLFNLLAGREAAIVTDIAGTTRDVLREAIQLNGLPLHLIDTAGLRDSSHPVEKEGIRRAQAEIMRADRVLFVVDSQYPYQGENTLETLPAGVPVIRVYNKIDLTGHLPGLSSDGSSVYLSAKTGEGIDTLCQHVLESIGYHPPAEGIFMARRRHIEALSRAQSAIERAIEIFQSSDLELIAEDLREAHNALGEITGTFTTDDLLGEIFSHFCIGK